MMKLYYNKKKKYKNKKELEKQIIFNVYNFDKRKDKYN